MLISSYISVLVLLTRVEFKLKIDKKFNKLNR